MSVKVISPPIPGFVFVCCAIKGDHTKLIAWFHSISQEFNGKTRLDIAWEAFKEEIVWKSDQSTIRAWFKDACVTICFYTFCNWYPFGETNNSLLMDKLQSWLWATVVHLVSLIAVGPAWTLWEIFPQIIEVLALNSGWDSLVKSSWHTSELLPKLGELHISGLLLIIIRVEVVLWASSEVPVYNALSEADTIIIFEVGAFLLEFDGLISCTKPGGWVPFIVALTNLWSDLHGSCELCCECNLDR